MGFSLKLVACAGLGMLLAAPAVMAPSMAAVAHPGFARPVGRPALPGVRRLGPGLDRRVGRRFPRYGFGDGYYGGAGIGLASTALDGQANDTPPQPYVPPIAPRPVCPMIIKIGPGLDHPVRTQVIYGSPACY